MADKVEFELVTPERLALAQGVDMVVVPGAEGDFGVLPQHSPFLSTVRPGVIDIYEGGKVTKRIFVAGGFAEVTETRCTVLAEEAIPVAELDRAAIETRLKNGKEALEDAETDQARAEAERTLAVANAMLAALPGGTVH